MTDDLQLALTFSAPIVAVPRLGSLDERFAAWSAANPHVIDAFERLALQSVRSGMRRVGAKALWEVLRWQHAIQTRDAAGWRCNNDYCSRTARLVADRNEELRDAFEVRALKSRTAA